jgi:hypothetical protein
MRERTFRIIAILCSAGSLVALPLLALSIADGNALTRAHASSSNPVWNPFSIVNPYKTAAVPSKAKRKNTALTAQISKTSQAAKTVAANAQPLLAAVQKPDIHANQQLLADTVLRSLPSGCRDHLKTFLVRYDHPQNRGLGGKTTIIIDGSVPDEEFMALLTHECGHVIHSNWQGNPASGESAFKDGATPFYNDSPVVAFFSIAWENEHVMRRGVGAKDVVSGYAKSDAFENFAETFTLYALHPDAIAAQAQDSAIIARQLTWMRTYLPMGTILSKSAYSWNGKAPWDVTRLPYAWVGPKTMAMN